MRACLFHGPGKLKVENVEGPLIKDGELLIKVESAAICGTDLRIYMGTKKIPAPRIIGHEFSGTIAESNDPMYAKGDRVSVYPIIQCGQCYACMEGRGNICLNRITLGYEIDGGFAEYIRIPRSGVEGNNVVKLPANVSFNEAAIAEPLAACIHGMQRLDLKLGESLWIIGAGPIGLMHLQLARLSGAGLIIVSEINETRRNIAERRGADYVFNSSEKDPLHEILSITDTWGVDKSIICTGSLSTIEDSIKAVRKGGKVVIFAGMPEGSNIMLNPNLIHYKEVDLMGSSASTPYLYKRGLQMVSKGKINLKSLITHELPLDDIGKALELKDRLEGLKILIKP